MSSPISDSAFLIKKTYQPQRWAFAGTVHKQMFPTPHQSGGTKPNGLADCFKNKQGCFQIGLDTVWPGCTRDQNLFMGVTGSLCKPNCSPVEKHQGTSECSAITLHAAVTVGHNYAGYTQRKFRALVFCQLSQVLSEPNGVFADQEVISS